MRGSRLLMICALALWGGAAPAIAKDPQDVPWYEQDSVTNNDADGPDPDDAPRAGGVTDWPDSPSPAAERQPDGIIDDPEPEAAPPDAAMKEPAPPSSQTPAESPAAPPAAAASTPAADPTTAAAPTAPTVAGNQFTLPFVQYMETKGTTLTGYAAADRDAMVQFYGERMGAVLWVTRTGFNDDAKALIAELGKADDWGLRASDYKIPALSSGGGDIGDDELTDAEVRLTLAALAYARHARGDRITDPTTQLSSYLDRKPNLIERKIFLTTLATAPDKAAYLRSTNPKHEQFERLRQKLLALRSGRTAETFEKIPNGKNIKAGTSHPDIALIRKRLKVPEPGMKPDGTAAGANYYDETLASAVVRFKEKAEITPASKTITSELRKTLNDDGRGGEASLLANMEEWRWMPDDLGAVHIEVNIPEFMVRVVKDGQVIHAERIISGKREMQTPVFSNQMSSVVFQPPWVVPDSIKVKELLPGLLYGGNPVARQGLVVERNGRRLDAWEVDWYQTDIRNYNIYQPPGPSNVLGVVKFLFPNKHAVYLHDTPSKNLFNEKVRAFSHGCMRVRNPVRLAEVILAEDKGWDAGTVNDVLNDGPPDNDIKLDKPLPVHVTYFTASVDDQGNLATFADVYGHEQRIKLALQGRWNEIQKNRDHLLPPVPSAVASRYREDGLYGDGPEGFWTYDPRGRPYYKKKYPKSGGFFDQLFGGF